MSRCKREVEGKKPAAVQFNFNNDGSFLEQFKKMQEETMKKSKTIYIFYQLFNFWFKTSQVYHNFK